jgi:N-acetylglutamate synthase-like GNAT family acetyltransferase
VIRQAGATDVEAILDLLTHYDLPREHFAPAYQQDPTYQPEESWVAEEDGHLLAHIRVYVRRIRASAAELRIAGVGNVVTARAARGRGHAGRLLQALLAWARDTEFAYSLLWTHIPAMYARYGWVPIDQEIVRARVPAVAEPSVRITAFTSADLPDVMRLYEASNAGRSGVTVRSPAYWQGQLAWLQEDPDGFLLARAHDDTLSGYVRSRARAVTTEILELGLAPGARDVGRALLGAAAARRDGRLEGHFPPSLRTLFRPDEHEVAAEEGLMGRVVNVDVLAHTLAPVWEARARAAGITDATFGLTSSDTRVAVALRGGKLRVDSPAPDEPLPELSEPALAHLLLRGFDRAAEPLVGDRVAHTLIRALFPEQDFVIWPADAF